MEQQERLWEMVVFFLSVLTAIGGFIAIQVWNLSERVATYTALHTEIAKQHERRLNNIEDHVL